VTFRCSIIPNKKNALDLSTRPSQTPTTQQFRKVLPIPTLLNPKPRKHPIKRKKAPKQQATETRKPALKKHTTRREALASVELRERFLTAGLEEQMDLTTHFWPKNPEQGKPGIEPFLDCHTGHCTISLLLLVVVNTAPLLPRDSPLFVSFPPTRCVHGDTRKAEAAIATKLGTCTGANPAAPHTHTHRGRKCTRT